MVVDADTHAVAVQQFHHRAHDDVVRAGLGDLVVGDGARGCPDVRLREVMRL